MKRFISVFISLVMLALSLTACACRSGSDTENTGNGNQNNNTGDAVKQIELTVWESTGVPDEFIRQAGERYTDMHPNVKIVNWQGGTHQRGQVGSLALGGIGAVNRMNAYIFFKFSRS